MGLVTINTVSEGTGIRFNPGPGDNGLVLQDAVLVSTDSHAIQLDDGQLMSVFGFAYGATNGLLATSTIGADVTIGETGHVIGGVNGVKFEAVAGEATVSRIINNGEIIGIDDDGIEGKGSNCQIINNGSISGVYGIYYNDSNANFVEIVNTGTISASGPNDFGIDLDVNNAGAISNSGTITNGILYSCVTGSFRITNSGMILADLGGSAIDKLTGSSSDRISNSGTIGGRVSTGTGNDVVYNSGQILGTVILAGGDDQYRSAVSGVVSGTVSGEAGNDTLIGGASDDDLNGGADNDLIRGMAGDDTLTGGAGSDRLRGGLGDDTYVVEDTLDTISEYAGEGTDTVESSVTFTLLANLEDLTLTGVSAINGTGNSGANRLTGNSSANTLNGAGGADVMAGGDGSDIYITDGGDTITELSNQGTDTVQSSVTFSLGSNLENLTLTGTAAINGTGNTLGNTLIGNAGANTLNGHSGIDTLTGGAGSDSFVFNTALGVSNIDTITDFNVIADTIRLENAVFLGLAAGTLLANAFAKNTSGNAVDANSRIIYETDTGSLWFDRDGTGAIAKVKFATIGTNLALTNADFLVF